MGLQHAPQHIRNWSEENPNCQLSDCLHFAHPVPVLVERHVCTKPNYTKCISTYKNIPSCIVYTQGQRAVSVKCNYRCMLRTDLCTHQRFGYCNLRQTQRAVYSLLPCMRRLVAHAQQLVPVSVYTCANYLYTHAHLTPTVTCVIQCTYCG